MQRRFRFWDRETGNLLGILHAAKAQSSGAVIAWGHQQQLAVLVVAIGLREIPDRALRLVMTSSTKDASPGVVVDVLIGPLPDVPHHVQDAEWTCPGWMRIDLIRRGKGAALVGRGNIVRFPGIAPGVKPILVP